MRLPDLQAAFQRFVLTGDAEIASHVVGTSRVPVQTRLAIYGEGYRSRLVESLESSFPALQQLMGEAQFRTLASRYIDTHESTFFSIRYYGDELAAFLAGDGEYSKVPLLAELAAWEWAMAAAFDAADIEPMGVDAFTRIPPEDWAELRLEWSPSVQVLELHWNVPEIWKAVTAGDEAPEPSFSATAGEWLIWRQELQIYFRPLAAEEAAAVAASRAGRTFGELCVLLCEHVGESEAPLRAAGFLRGWVQSGLIVK